MGRPTRSSRPTPRLGTVFGSEGQDLLEQEGLSTLPYDNRYNGNGTEGLK